MKLLKKILKITGISLVVLLLLAFTIPIVFKKQVQAIVKKEINKQLNAKVDFTDASLSLFRHFPKATIRIKGLSIVGTGDYAADTLIAAKNLDITAGLFSVLKGKDIKVHGLYLNQPRIHLLMDEAGNANWDIAKSSGSSSTDTSSSAFKISLKNYKISEGYLVYNDKKASTYTELDGLTHSGSGDITADVFTLSTSTSARSAWFTQDGIPYLVNTKTDLDADINIDNKTNTYTFKTEDIQLNALKLAAEGFVQMLDAATFKMDIKFKSPDNDFKNILSMVPAMYTKDFAGIKTSGEASFNGFVKGTYSPNQVPAYDVKLLVKNGSFQYPDLPKPVSNIHLDLRALNTDGQPDHSVIDISKGHLEFDKEPFDFNFTYKNPVTIQYIDAGAKGKLDLSQLSKFIKLEAGTKLSGLVWADAFIKGPLKAIQQQSGPFSAGGFFDIRNLYYSDKSFPQPVSNGNIKATLANAGGIADNTVIDVSSGHIELGKDPIDFTLKLSNPVSTVNFAGKARGRLTLDHLKQFSSFPAGTSLSGIMNADMGFAGSRDAINKGAYDKIMLDGRADFSNVMYKAKEYPGGISIPSSSLLFDAKNITLSNLAGTYIGTHFTAAGTLNNLVGFMMENQALSGNLNATADKMNLNDWMGSPATPANTAKASTTGSSSTSSGASPFQVPANVNFKVNARVNEAIYDQVAYKNINGEMLIADEKLTLKNVKTDVLDGAAIINGSYSTRLNKKEPDIGFSYVIKDMDVQKAFNAYNTIQLLMPIGKFLSGKLNSELSLVGNLQSTMMPKLNSLTGNGNLLLLQGVLKKFAPLEKLATVLQIDRLKSISVKDIRNYIEFANGRVLVKPFTIKIDDIEMQIGGFHGFDQSIDYSVQMKLPRSVMGNSGNNLINNLAAQATSKGFPVKLGETVDLSIKLTGSINDPSVGINLKEMAGSVIDSLKEQAKDFVQAKMDSIKQKAKDSITAVKDQVKEKIKDKLKEQILGKDTSKTKPDSIPPVNPQPKDTGKTSTKEVIKNKLKDLLNRNKKPKDSTTQ